MSKTNETKKKKNVLCPLTWFCLDRGAALRWGLSVES